MRIESDDSSRGPEFGALKSRKKQNTIYIYIQLTWSMPIWDSDQSF